MTTEHKIIAFLVILANFVIYVYSDNGDCPSKPCLQDKPKLGAQDKLVLGYFYDQYEEGSTAVANIFKYICKLIKKCGDQISIKQLPGAIVTKDANGELVCPGGFCFGDQEHACRGIAIEGYFTSCIDFVPIETTQNCLDNQLCEANNILIANGEHRKRLGIPDCRLPVAVTFNEKYDLCANFNSYDDLKTYVCELYNNNLGCCR